MNSRRLPTDSAMRTHNAAVGRDPVYSTAANGSRLPTGVFTPTTGRDSTVSSRRRRRCVLGIRKEQDRSMDREWR